MEELIISEINNQVAIQKEMGKYGYEREISDKQRQAQIGYNVGGERYADFDKMKLHDSRLESVKTVYYGLDLKMENLFRRANQLEIRAKFKDAVNGEAFYQDQKKDIDKVENYSQVGIFNHINELAYEYKAAQKCEQRNSTKDSRKRVEKRRKALSKHKAAVMASADAAFVRFEKLGLAISGIGDNTDLISENNKKDAYESLEKTLTAKQELISSIKDAEDYDTENNIKMKRVGKKRVIDLGKGTTEYFQKLSKIRTAIKVYDISVKMNSDYASFGDLVPQNYRRRFDQKSTKINQDTHAKKEKIISDINGIADRIPDLICALKPYADKAELIGLIAQFKTSDAEGAKMEFVNTIMAAPQILACIRKDMRNHAVPTDFALLADTLTVSFRKIAAQQPKPKA